MTELEPLRGLAGLEVLELPRTKVSDLEPLAGLAALRRLDLSRTRVADLGPLAGWAARVAEAELDAGQRPSPLGGLGASRSSTSRAPPSPTSGRWRAWGGCAR